jgi:hypothetical protein
MGGVYLPNQDCGNNPCAPGACCSPSVCTIADAFSCITAGRDFVGAGTTCAGNPCGLTAGACCLGTVCTTMSQSACTGAGGMFLGIGTICVANACQSGSCCLPAMCAQMSGYDCNAAGGTFTAGANCANNPCDIPNNCSTDSLYYQSGGDPDAGGYTSEAAAGLQRWDNFTSVPGAVVTELTWFGFDLFFNGMTFSECVETDNTFQITFHPDDNGAPGPAACSYFLQATSTPAIVLENYVINEYHVTLPTPCAFSAGWVSIVGFGDPTCWFLWLGSHDGDGLSLCDNCQSHVQGADFSFCLGGIISPAGDLDHDGDVDLADAAVLVNCLTGPNNGPPPDGCAPADLDTDNDVDLHDVAVWVNGFTG